MIRFKKGEPIVPNRKEIKRILETHSGDEMGDFHDNILITGTMLKVMKSMLNRSEAECGIIFSGPSHNGINITVSENSIFESDAVEGFVWPKSIFKRKTSTKKELNKKWTEVR